MTAVTTKINNERKCIRCNEELQKHCDDICVPCLLKQGDRYVQTGNPQVFFRGYRE